MLNWLLKDAFKKQLTPLVCMYHDGFDWRVVNDWDYVLSLFKKSKCHIVYNYRAEELFTHDMFCTIKAFYKGKPI
jgi:hypothetical protein